MLLFPMRAVKTGSFGKHRSDTGYVGVTVPWWDPVSTSGRTFLSSLLTVSSGRRDVTWWVRVCQTGIKELATTTDPVHRRAETNEWAFYPSSRKRRWGGRLPSSPSRTNRPVRVSIRVGGLDERPSVDDTVSDTDSRGQTRVRGS